MWVLFGFFLLSQLDGLGAVGVWFVELFLFFIFKDMQPTPHPWKSLENVPGTIGLHPICRNPPGGGVTERGRGNCAPESEADRVSLVMLLSPWRWLERRGGGGGEDILGRVGADATS